MKSLLSLLACLTLIAPSLAQPIKDKAKESKIGWKKTVIDAKFRSEGVAVADVNGDGKKDILVGDLWYEAPDWKPHAIRKEKTYDGAKGYSEAFAVFADDVDKDGLVDQIVVGFPGAPCHWYKNPGKTGEPWKAFAIQDNACNETPLFVDLLGIGKKGLLLGHKGEMAFFIPGNDATKPWTKVAISGPGKSWPGTHHFAHGLGAGDVNGDSKLDVLTSGGWWEQPLANPTLAPWKFHPYKINDCADIIAFDVDGDGKNDLISTSAHNTGMWWHQRKEAKDHPAFVSRLLFPLPAELAKPAADLKLTKEESDLYAAINKVRSEERKAPWRLNAKLCRDARLNAAVAAAQNEGKFELRKQKYEGEIIAIEHGEMANVGYLVREFFDKNPKLRHPGLEVGVGTYESGGKKSYMILVGDNDQFAVPGQTHAVHFVDIDGDGLKDLVTGRRYWAHGPKGDDTPGDAAVLYWFKAKKDKTGFTTFEPHMVDDDSGVGTQFAVEDINGDGLLDIIVSNKRGVFLFVQTREEVIRPVPPPMDE